MDPDIRSMMPGRCPRCNMTLVAGMANADPYRLKMTCKPRAPRAGRKLELEFRVCDPITGRFVSEFEWMHEKLFHLFFVSQDLRYFAHEHPVKTSGGSFRFETVLPRGGMYRIVSDFYPRGGSPQLAISSLVLPGLPVTAGAPLSSDLEQKSSLNLQVSLTLQPARPIAGMKTLLLFRLSPADGLERYLGAWGHMLLASSDLVDLLHQHPTNGNGGAEVQFDVMFPRPGVYKIWVQFQRNSVVNTVSFQVPVASLSLLSQ